MKRAWITHRAEGGGVLAAFELAFQRPSALPGPYHDKLDASLLDHLHQTRAIALAVQLDAMFQIIARA